jgi:hypothetical protein
LIWNCMGYARKKAISDFLFRTYKCKPGRIFSA